jgi:glucose/arabinose dehydrogenase
LFKGQGGLLDVVLSPGFASDQTVWFRISEAEPLTEYGARETATAGHAPAFL